MPRKKQQTTRSSAANKKVIGIITKEKQLSMMRQARRKSDIESGINAASQGTGAWGGTKRQQRRRQRRLVQDEVRDFQENQES
jgi:hypothetical protein